MTFAERVLAFFRQLTPPDIPLPEGFSWLFPYDQEETKRVMALFYRRFYADEHPRAFVFGINPGRFGAGVTGVPFTDPIRLEADGGIPNAFSKRPELSAQFVWEVVRAFGGPNSFFRHFYLTALLPLGFTCRGRNINYYDDPQLLRAVGPFLRWNIRTQMAFGARRHAALCLGEGKNAQVLRQINAENGLFERILSVPHPRWIMQYDRKRRAYWVEQYLQALHALQSE